MFNTKQQGRFLKILSLSILLLSGCNTKTPEEQVVQAQLYHSQGNTEVAIIELKNILQQTPKMEAALLALDKIYAEKRQYVDIINLLYSPVKEGLSNQDILYSLVDALIHDARFEEAFSVINNHPDMFNTAQGIALTGHCFAGLNKTEEAKEYYHQSLLLDENLISAHLGLAQEAIIFAEKHKPTTKQKNNYINKSTSEQLNWVERSGPDSRGNDDSLQSAKSHLQKVLDIDVDNIIGNYLLAATFYLEKNITEAQQSISRVLKVEPDHKESLLLMGKLHLELTHLDKSEEFLKRYIKITPDDVKARMYLASIMLRKHQPELALELLEGYSETGEKDPEYLLILGNIYLAKNNNSFAIDYFEKAHAIYPESALVKMYSAMGYLARNDRHEKDRESAVQLLEEVLKIEPENFQAGISLTTTLLQESNYKRAEKIASNMIIHSPKKPLPWYLSGLAWQGLGNIDKAIIAFINTLELNHSFVPATLRLTKIYQQKGDYELAQKHYKAALYDSPYNSEIMTEMAIYEQKIGNNEKAVEILELARDRNHDSLSPRLLLGSYYLHRGQINTAQDILSELIKLEPERPDVQMFFGQVQLATGRSSEAVSIFSKLVQLEPDSSELLTAYGRSLRMNGQVKASRNILETVFTLSESIFPDALIELGELELVEKNYHAIVPIITNLKTNYPELPGGYLLEGDLAMRQKHYQDAILPYELAIKRNETTLTILKLYEAYVQSGMNNKAHVLLENAVSKYTDDLRLGMTLANVSQKSGDTTAAIELYQKLLNNYPDNALILNNLAWVYDLTDRKKALYFAERAYKITPDLPQIIDSYGWFCILDGRVKEGLSLLRTAVKKAPSDPEFRYHLAEAQIKSGENESARKSLELALGSQENFNGRSDAEELLARLSREQE